MRQIVKIIQASARKDRVSEKLLLDILKQACNKKSILDVTAMENFIRQQAGQNLQQDARQVENSQTGADV